MKNIKENIEFNMKRIEKWLSFYTASFIASLILGYINEFSIIINFVWIFSLIKICRYFLIYKKIKKIEKIISAIEQEIIENKLSEKEGIMKIEDILKEK